tara:strand:+ start:845 stop:1894 length:1050 start_codon:yes stop_codon:yes gene_type:complete
MTIYLYLFLFFILLFTFILLETKKINLKRKNIFIFLSTLLILISSFRWEVGGDWDSYLSLYNQTSYSYDQFYWSLTFEIVNHFFALIGGGIYGVNLFIASIFYLALYRFAKILDFDILLILLISFSLVYFNGLMGYVRQTLCLTFLIFSIEFLFRKKNHISTLSFILAVTSHISAIIFIPIYFFIHFKNLRNTLIILFISVFLFFIYNNTLFEAFDKFVIKGNISAGSIYRSFPLILCCIFFLIFRKKFKSDNRNYNFLKDYLFFLSILLILIIFLVPSLTTVADRLSFYLIIFQIIICGRFFNTIIRPHDKKYLHSIIFVSISYFLFTFSWLVFGDYSIFWLDYNFLY